MVSNHFIPPLKDDGGTQPAEKEGFTYELINIFPSSSPSFFCSKIEINLQSFPFLKGLLSEYVEKRREEKIECGKLPKPTHRTCFQRTGMIGKGRKRNRKRV
jgi:hypothetical protein